MDFPRLLLGTDAGLELVGPRPGRELAGHEITALSVAGTERWALLDGRTLWRCRAKGDWTPVDSAEKPRANCVLAWHGGALVGLAGAHLLRLRSGALQRVDSFDKAPGRDDWFTPWGGPPDVRSLSRGPEGWLYVNVHVGGVLRSRDSGRSWQPTVEIEADVHQVLAHPARAGVVLAPSGVGLGFSRDGGDSWSFAIRGFHAVYQRAVALVEDVILVSTSRSERGQEAAVYRRPLDGRRAFHKCERGLPRWFPSNINTGCLAAAGPIAAIGSPDGSVFVSRDRGVTWEVAREGMAKIRCLAFG